MPGIAVNVAKVKAFNPRYTHIAKSRSVGYPVRASTCGQFQQSPPGLVDLEAEPGFTQVKPDHAPSLRNLKGQEQSRLVPRPELEPRGQGPRP